MDDAEQVLAKGSRTFSLAARFLPAANRRDAALLYAFCRYVDDTADEADDASVAQRALLEIDQELERGETPRPAVRAFLSVAERRQIDRRHAQHLVTAVASDLGEVRVPDDAALLRYAYGVAGTVGLMMCGVLGVRSKQALAFAIDLGIAMQLTNICRDVAEDAALGRIYLPAERLRRAGLDPDELLRRPAQAQPESVRGAVREAVAEILALAERYYRSAEQGMAFIPAVPRLAIFVAARLYREIGRLLLARGGDPLTGRTVVPPWRKARVTLRALLAFLRPRGLGKSRALHDARLHRSLEDLPGAHANA